MSRAYVLKPRGVVRLFFRMGGWVVVLLGFVVAILLFESSSSLEKAVRLDADGVHTLARVTDKTSLRRRVGDRYEEIRTIAFVYETSDGRLIELRRQVGSDRFDRVRIGSHIDIWYAPSHPTEVELRRGSLRDASRSAQWIALVVGLVWLFSLWRVGDWAVQAIRARRYGRRMQAKVTGVVESNWVIQWQKYYRLAWCDETGRHGQSLLYRRQSLQPFARGDTISVHQGKSYVWWSGDVGDRPEH